MAAAEASAAVAALAAAAAAAPSFKPVVATLEAHAAAQPQLGAWVSPPSGCCAALIRPLLLRRRAKGLARCRHRAAAR
jgi:hypothetical protein